MGSNDIWAKALTEAESPDLRNPGLWAKCFAEADGDEGKAKAAYVKLRVAEEAPSAPASSAKLPGKILGYCPNCNYELSMNADACSNCKAIFGSNDWKPTLTPQGNSSNGYLGQRDTAQRQQSSTSYDNVQVVKTAKSRGIYIILALFFGLIGVHNFYAGRYGRGAAQLIITAVLGWFVVGIVITFLWTLVDMFTVTTDGDGHRMS